MRVVAALVLFIALAAANAAHVRWLAYPADKPETLVHRLLQTVRVFVGDVAWMQGDLYLHRGIAGDEQRSLYNVFRPYSPFSFPGGGNHHEGTEHAGGDAHGDEEAAAGTAALDTLCEGHEGQEVAHVHLKDDTQLLPLFWITAQMDPWNIQNWVVGSYWLVRAGKTNEAITFLDNGLRHNPEDPDIELELGVRLYYAGSFDRAALHLYGSLFSLTNTISRRRAYTYLGRSCERLGCLRFVPLLRAEWIARHPGEPLPPALCVGQAAGD
ncbi:tetratricopeptide repeat protein [bacterium]|nr:tetratricopeptide repeat protein [bacterium]